MKIFAAFLLILSFNITAFAKECMRIFPDNFDYSERHFETGNISFRDDTTTQIERAYFEWPEEFNFSGEFGRVETGDGFGRCERIDFNGDKPHHLRGFQMFRCPYFVENGYREGNQYLAYNYRTEILVWLGDINPYASGRDAVEEFNNLTESPRFQCVE